MTEERRVLLHLFLCDSSERDRRRSSTVVVVQIKPEHALLSTWYLSRGLGRTRTCKNTEGIFKTGIKKKRVGGLVLGLRHRVEKGMSGKRGRA